MRRWRVKVPKINMNVYAKNQLSILVTEIQHFLALMCKIKYNSVINN